MPFGLYRVAFFSHLVETMNKHVARGMQSRNLLDEIKLTLLLIIFKAVRSHKTRRFFNKVAFFFSFCFVLFCFFQFLCFLVNPRILRIARILAFRVPNYPLSICLLYHINITTGKYCLLAFI